MSLFEKFHHDMVNCNECLKNIFHNFVPNKVTTKCDYRQPPLMTYSVKGKLKEYAKLTRINLKI